MKISRLLAVSCVVALLGVAGCSDDDNPVVDLGQVQAAQAAFGDALANYLMPLTAIDIPLPAVAPAVSRGNCNPVPCLTGSGDICSVAVNEYEGIFSSCDYNGAILNGNYELMGTPAASTLVFLAFSINSLGFDGQVDLVDDGTCETLSFTNMVLSSGGNSVTLGGSMMDCDDPFPTGGPLTMTVPTAIGDFRFDITMNGTSTIFATVVDVSSGDTVATCEGDLITGDHMCS